jgi:hypothetical protein
MKNRSFALSVSIPFLFAACAGETTPPAVSPEPAPVVNNAVAPAAVAPAPAAVVETPVAPPAEAPKPPTPTLKESLGEVVKVEIVRGTKKTEISKTKDVEGILKAVGTDQVPSDARRRCLDDVSITLKDKVGAPKGTIGFCNVEGLGGEFQPSAAPAGDRRGIKVTDEPGLRKILDLKPSLAPIAVPTAQSKNPIPPPVNTKK